MIRVAAMLVAVVFAGCAGRYAAATPNGPDPRIVVTDSILRRDLLVTAGEVVRRAGGGLQLVLEFLNDSGSELWIDVKVEFFDVGRTIPTDQTPWTPVLVRPHDTTRHKATSLSSTADDFRVSVRRVR